MNEKNLILQESFIVVMRTLKYVRMALNNAPTKLRNIVLYGKTNGKST